MERSIITMDESGYILIPDNVADIRMSGPELVELFGVTVPALRAAIRAVYKSCILKEYEVQKYVRLENGFHADVFSFPMVAALAFRVNTFGAEQVRNVILERVCLRKEKTSIFFSLGTSGIGVFDYQA